MEYFNTIYPYSLNSEPFIKNVKTFSSLDVKCKNLKHQIDCKSIYSLLTYQLNKKKLQKLKEENQKFLKLF